MTVKAKNQNKKNIAEDESSMFDAARLTEALEAVIARGWSIHRPMPAVTTVSANQIVSLKALIAYVADRSGESELSVSRRLTDRFNIPNVRFLPADQFDSALRYLVDGVKE